MVHLAGTYTGGGSNDFPYSLSTMGEHNARYDLYGGCGPGNAKLPTPDLQPLIK